jgi:hypothetical protein
VLGPLARLVRGVHPWWRADQAVTASAALSRHVKKLVGYPPLSEMDDLQRREFHEALLDADGFEALPGEVAGGNPEGGTESAEAAAGQQQLSIAEGDEGHSRARLSLRSPRLSAFRGLCRIRTIWRRPPHSQGGIVSVRLGTLLQVTFPHAWQRCSAIAAMSGGLPESASRR